MRTLICGGGTGGHVYPALAVVEALVDEGERQEDILYVGAPGSVEEKLAKRHGLPFAVAESGQLLGKAPWTMARSLARLGRGVNQASEVIAGFQPAVVFSTGGYSGAPAMLAARRANVPALIYLPDIEPGITIRLLSRLAKRVAVSFDELQHYFPAHKVIVTGYPVRKALHSGDRQGARQRLGLNGNEPVVLVFGGSQGARSINYAAAEGAQRLAAVAQVLHVTGSLDYQQIVQRVGAALGAQTPARYHVYEYLHEEMADALLAADLAVARAGASTLGEFPAVGLPAVLAPYPYSGQHQYANARFLADRGAAVIIEDALLGEKLTATVEGLLRDAALRGAMAEAARALAKPAAADNLASELRRLAAGRME